MNRNPALNEGSRHSIFLNRDTVATLSERLLDFQDINSISLASRKVSCNLECPLLNNIVVDLDENSWVVEMWR